MIREAATTDSKDLALLMGELGYPTNPDDMMQRLSKIFSNPIKHSFLREMNS